MEKQKKGEDELMRNRGIGRRGTPWRPAHALSRPPKHMPEELTTRPSPSRCASAGKTDLGGPPRPTADVSRLAQPSSQTRALQRGRRWWARGLAWHGGAGLGRDGRDLVAAAARRGQWGKILKADEEKEHCFFSHYCPGSPRTLFLSGLPDLLSSKHCGAHERHTNHTHAWPAPARRAPQLRPHRDVIVTHTHTHLHAVMHN